MAKVKKGFLTAILLLVTAIFCVPFSACNDTADGGQEKSAVDEEVTTLGLYTDLQFSLRGENGEVFASVENKFTLFPSTVTVNLELYRSEGLKESVSEMTLVSSNYIHDLDQGETIVASASTEGRQSYWKARAYYKVDNKPWRESFSETLRFNGLGTKISIHATMPEDRNYYLTELMRENAQIMQGVIGHSEYIEPDSESSMGVWNRVYDLFKFKNDDLIIIKKLLTGVKISPFALDTLQAKTYFIGGIVSSDLELTLNYGDGEYISVSFNDINKDESGVNIFVTYSINEISYTFVALIDDTTKNTLLEFSKNLYENQKGDN